MLVVLGNGEVQTRMLGGLPQRANYLGVLLPRVFRHACSQDHVLYSVLTVVAGDGSQTLQSAADGHRVSQLAGSGQVKAGLLYEKGASGFSN